MTIIKSIVVAVAVVLLFGIGYLVFEAVTADPNITSFEECVAAGYSVAKSLPATCQTPEGQIFTENTSDENINSFEGCVAAGYPVRESYPEQCQTASGKTFSREIGNELDKSDLIRIDFPRPGGSIESPITITGEARGQWFFEATFPITLVDDNDKELARTFAEATDDWMTENFVPYKSSFSFLPPSSATGQLILEKSNPSGLPEHADSLIIPVRFADFQPQTSNPRAQDGCVITGCSGQICADQETPSTCEYREIYACYQTTICKRSPAGQCEWQDSPALTQCLDQF